jgi:hypothetical protein
MHSKLVLSFETVWIWIHDNTQQIDWNVIFISMFCFEKIRVRFVVLSAINNLSSCLFSLCICLVFYDHDNANFSYID